jgi:putative ABC transport system permease protein
MTAALLLLRRLVIGHLLRRRAEAALCVFGVAVGVAVTVGIDLAVRSAVDSFAATTAALMGDSSHSLVGGAGGIDEDVYVRLARDPDAPAMTPILDRAAVAGGQQPGAGPRHPDPLPPGERGPLLKVRVLGVDPFADRDFRKFSDVAETLKGRDGDFTEFLTRPDTCVLIEPLAERLGVAPGGTLTLTVGNAVHKLRVLGTFRVDGPGGRLLDDLVVTDIAAAQELFDAVGRLDRIDLRVADDAEGAARLERLRGSLPAGVRLTEADEQNRTLERLTAAYRLNLHALSLMASFVAVFVVYNTLLVSVANRRAALGVIRCLGGTPWQIGGLFAAEALAMGLAGGLLGIGLGRLLSDLLVGMVAGTFADFYSAVQPLPAELTPAVIAKGLAVGVLSALAGAAVPVIRAARVEPILAVKRVESARGGRRTSRRLFWIGLAVVAAGWVSLDRPAPTVAAGFVGAALVMTGAALMSGEILAAGCAVAARIGGAVAGPAARLGARNVAADLGVSGVAVAALMSALSMSVGIGTMVSGFREAVLSWLDRRFQADVYVASRAWSDFKIDTPVPPQVIADLAADPAVRRVTTNRITAVHIDGHDFHLVCSHLDVLLSEGAVDLREALPGDLTARLGDGAIVSGPVATRLGLEPGGTLRFALPGGGSAPLTVLAVANDFTSDRGQILLDRATYRRLTGDDAVNSVYVYLRDPAGAAAFRERWNRGRAVADGLTVLVHADIKAEAARIFDRTFAVTDMLRWMAYAVAFAGLAGALSAQAVRRLREFGVLRLLGMSRRQTLILLAAEGLVPALTAAAMSLVVGTALAWILAKVVQFRSFGWAIPLEPQPGIWARTVLLAAAAALPAGLYPLWRLSRVPPAALVREE